MMCWSIAACLLLVLCIALVLVEGHRSPRVQLPAGEQRVIEKHANVESETHAILDETSSTSPSVASSTPLGAMEGKLQYVLLAFDGSESLHMWDDTLAFSREMEAMHKPVHFTYFINPVYLIAEKDRMAYVPPVPHATGTSAIGFAYSEHDVANRLGRMNTALDQGQEIGAHLVGHWDGSKWSPEQWRQEFKSFFDLIDRVGEINHLSAEPAQRRTLHATGEHAIIGFRAPELGINNHLWPVLTEFGIRYDTSMSAKPASGSFWLANGVREIPLARIPYGHAATSTILSMDYNFFFKQTGAKDIVASGTPEWDRLFAETLTSYRRYFDQQYTGTRAPVMIGHHFSLWNGGVYWEVLKEFAREVCGLPDVRCVTHKTYFQSLSSPTL